MFNKKLIVILLSLTLSIQIMAQTPSISGKILDEETNKVPFATVLLFKISSDTVMAKAMPSNAEGEYFFNKVEAGNYYIEASFVGYSKNTSEAFSYDGNSEFSVTSVRLSPESQHLEDVVVSATRPIVEVQPDKTVFNVEGSINASGNTALELLRKSPGVVVDNNDNLMLQGKNGVIVYIDGKKSPLSSDDLANYLKTLQSNEIDAIEIVTNPSAKYDAEGNAGIINIRLIKDKSLGSNGTVNLGYRYGVSPKYNGSLGLNHRNRKLNAFGNYSLFQGDHENRFNIYREQGGSGFDQVNVGVNGNTSHGYKLGADFFLGKKSTLGFIINGNSNDSEDNSRSNTDIYNLSTRNLDSLLVATNHGEGERNNTNFNINYVLNAGDGKTLNIDLDYGRFRNTGESYQPNFYYLSDGSTVLSERIFSNVTPTDIDIYTIKIDWESNLAGGKLGVGAKSSFVRTDNTFDNFDIVNGNYIKNYDRSNNFLYDENVVAAYVSWQKKIGQKWDIMAGLRSENTISKGDLSSTQTANDKLVERDYLNFFPSGGLTFQMNQKNNFRLNYSRRIDRPNYQNLNPFEFKLDELSYRQGNPFLNPQYSNSFSLTHTFKYTLSTSLSYTVTKDVSTQITESRGENAAILSFVNLAEQSNLAITVSYPFSVAKWWNVYATATGYMLHNEANIEGNVIDLTTNSFNFYGQNTFSLPQGIKLELSGWYNSPAIWGGNWTTGAQYDVSAGVSKQIFKDKGNLKVSVSDIFKTNPWTGESSLGQLYMKGGGSWESRQVRFNFSYRFGSNQVKAARKRNTGMEEENKRTQSSS